MPKEDIISQRGSHGIGSYSTSATQRGIYPAIVVPNGNIDDTEQGRLRVRLISVDDNGNIKGKRSELEENYDSFSGRDAGKSDKELVYCIPLLPSFFHVIPQVGEMVFVILENPKDDASVRYWMGPIITSKFKLGYQSYEDAFRIFNKSDSPPNRLEGDLKNIFPKHSDIAIQGRNDADLILKNREAILIAGKFDTDRNYNINTECPSYLKLKQYDTETPIQENIPTPEITHEINAEMFIQENEYVGKISVKHINNNLYILDKIKIYTKKSDVLEWIDKEINEAKKKYKNWLFKTDIEEYKGYPINSNIKPTNRDNFNNMVQKGLLERFSQAEITSTSINIFSPKGKFRGESIKHFEKNEYLKLFGDISDSLHPALFGDETIKLLDIIIRLLISHIHTPEKPLLQTELSDELSKYTVDGQLQNLISNHVRIN